MNLSNQIPLARQQALNKVPEIVPTSIIDIDIIQGPLDVQDNSMLMDIVDQAHTIEKEIFFNLLTQTFLQTLNPEY